MNTALGLLPVNPQTAAASGKTANNKPKSQQNNSFSDKLNTAVSQSEAQQTTDGKTEKLLLPDLPTNLVIKTAESADKQVLPESLDMLTDELPGSDDGAMLPADQLLQTAVNTALTVPGFIPVPTAASESAAPEATVAPVTAPSINLQQQAAVSPESAQMGTLFAETANNPASQAQLPAELIPTATTAANTASLNTQQMQGNLPQSVPSAEDIATIGPQTVIAGQSQIPKAETGMRNERLVEAEQQPAEAEVLPLLPTDQQGKQASKGFSGEGQKHSSAENPLSQPKLAQDLSINTVEVNKTHTFTQGLDTILTKTGTTAAAETKQPGVPFADVHQVAEQIVAQTRLIAKPQNTEMIIRLKPEHLGELTLKVAVENGVVNASFHSNNSEVRNIIEQSLPQLKLDLANNGLKVDNVSVSAGLDQFLPNHDQDRNSRQQFIKLTNKKDAEGFVEAIDGEVAEGRIPGTGSQAGVDYRI
ncbi:MULTISPECIES: flagellar hook-length control protein FliK [Sporomusa]|uniref:flagellar hook-length control protein FliK n=1 Tax=Sporomusa TaxID=2375 RepID=UPI0016648BDD|nr:MULTISPECIES: flagellar hook-length control protein FliK [Sporomusa]MCM0760191.1 flagellar hook-length control protein FliK [Sporomusa sphaeroides DSM 2875]